MKVATWLCCVECESSSAHMCSLTFFWSVLGACAYYFVIVNSLNILFFFFFAD